MKIIEQFLTNNPCYKAGRKISVKGLMLHSVGCPQPNAQVFIKQWNSASYDRACVHGFIDGNTGVIYQTLPWNHRGWHGGGSSNNTHIGVEMCEPSCIKYTGGSTFTCSNITAARKSATLTYNAAVELFAMLCKKYNLNPLQDGVIVSHKEGHDRGIASNHGDPEHLWRGLGLSFTMNGFRQDVYKKMNNIEEDENMTVERFKELFMEMRKELQDNDHSQWSDEAIRWAIQNGLLVGDGKLPSRESNYMLEDLLTREQLIAVLYRFAKLMGKA